MQVAHVKISITRVKRAGYCIQCDTGLRRQSPWTEWKRTHKAAIRQALEWVILWTDRGVPVETKGIDKRYIGGKAIAALALS